MTDALNILYVIIQKFFELIFGLYLFQGVSVGMLMVVGLIFTLLIKYFVAAPKGGNNEE